jgi:hypothetical protein
MHVVVVAGASDDLHLRVHIAPETIACLFAFRFGEQIQSSHAVPDGIHMLGDEVAPRVEARGRACESERDQQPHEAEDRAIDRA